MYDGNCGSRKNWLSFESGDFFYMVRGGCGDASIYADFSQPQTFWDGIWISEGAILMSTTGPDSDGLITKKFNLKSGEGYMDRVAFFVRGTHGVGAADVAPATAYCSGCDQSTYEVIGWSGNGA